MWLRYHNFFVFIFSFVGYLALALANFKGKESIEGIEGRERLKQLIGTERETVFNILL